MHRLLFALVLIASGCSSDETTTPAHDDDHDHGDHGAPDSGAPANTEDSGSGGGNECTSALEQLLTPIDSVSTGVVTVLSDTDGTKTLYVDASAGGTMAAPQNPRLYLNLGTGERVDVSDLAAHDSRAWDLAIKRPVLFANSGDGGPGEGGAVFVEKDFDDVASSDAESASFAAESFVGADCTPKVDQTNAVLTSFGDWYDYNTENNTLKPKTGTWIIKGGTGSFYKVKLLSYYSTPTGAEGQAGGHYSLQVGAL